MSPQRELFPVVPSEIDNIAVLREMVRVHGPRAAAAIAVELAELRREDPRFQKFMGRLVASTIFEGVLSGKTGLCYAVGHEKAEKELAELEEDVVSFAFDFLGHDSTALAVELREKLTTKKTVRPKSHFSHPKKANSNNWKNSKPSQECSNG